MSLAIFPMFVYVSDHWQEAGIIIKLAAGSLARSCNVATDRRHLFYKKIIYLKNWKVQIYVVFGSKVKIKFAQCAVAVFRTCFFRDSTSYLNIVYMCWICSMVVSVFVEKRRYFNPNSLKIGSGFVESKLVSNLLWVWIYVLITINKYHNRGKGKCRRRYNEPRHIFYSLFMFHMKVTP